jgi:hypothetical protein
MSLSVHRGRRAVAATASGLITALVLGVAGCGGDDGDTSPLGAGGAGSGTSATSVTGGAEASDLPGDGAPSNPPGADTFACAELDEAALSAATGLTLRPAEIGYEQPDGMSCHLVAEETVTDDRVNMSIDVTVAMASELQQWDESPGEAEEPVTGLGDEAWWSITRGLRVRDGDLLVSVYVALAGDQKGKELAVGRILLDQWGT